MLWFSVSERTRRKYLLSFAGRDTTSLDLLCEINRVMGPQPMNWWILPLKFLGILLFPFAMGLAAIALQIAVHLFEGYAEFTASMING